MDTIDAKCPAAVVKSTAELADPLKLAYAAGRHSVAVEIKEAIARVLPNT